MFNKNAMKKTSQVLVLAMLLMVFMPIIAFAAGGFSGVSFDGKNVSASVYGSTYSQDAVTVYVYGPDGVYVTSTTATYSTYNVTDSVYVYTIPNFNVTGSVYNTVTLKAPDVTTSVYTATYTTPVVVTPTVDTTPPAWTGTLSATPGETSVALSWPAATDSSTVTYHVYNGNSFVTTVTGTTYTVNGLTAGTLYGFKVKAVDASGNWSTTQLITTATTTTPVDTTPPVWTGAVLSATPGETSVALSWPVATDASTVTYQVYKGNVLVAIITGGPAHSYTVTGLTAGTSYDFKVKAVDASGNWAATELTTTVTTTSAPVVDTTPPDWTGAVLSATATQTTVALSWPAATDASAVSYYVHQNGSLIATVTGITYTVTGLTAGTNYTFMIGAMDEYDNISTTQLTKIVSTLNGGGNVGGITPTTPGSIEPGADGKVDSKALTDAFKGSDNPQVKVKDVASLPASALIEAAKKAGTSLTITSENGTYVLPLSLLKLDDLAKSLGIAVADLNIKVSITKVSGTTAAAVADEVKAIGATSLTDAIDFKVTAEGKDGKSVEINNFGNTYVSRSVTISKSVDMKKVTGVLYNEVTKKLSFVPATFETKDGKTVATLKRNGNSIYTVVEMNKSFTDIASHWSKDDVSLLANKLVIDGATDTTFAPDLNITRGEFAALVVRSLGLNTDAASTTFADVKSSDWYAGAVAAAAGAKIINGYEDGTFKADAQITREELAAMVVRALTFAGVKSDLSATQQATLLGKFTDAGQIVWADKEIAAAVDAGIINGLTDTTIGSGKQATRAEAATMLKRFLTKAGFIN